MDNASSRIVMAIFLALFISGCSEMSKQNTGTGLGIVIGGAMGSQVNTKHKTSAVVLGALIGGAIGNQVGKYLDDKDRAAAGEAQQRALETGRPQTWQNSVSGNSGRVNVVDKDQKSPNTSPNKAKTNSSARPASPDNISSSSANAGQKPCKTIRQSITLKDGSTHEEDVTACKGPNGWEAV